MKVIKHGDVYSQKSFECDMCGCVYIAENSEYHFEPMETHKESGDLYVCSCPECGARNTIVKK